MFVPTSMELISVVVFKDKLEALAAQLVALGIFHPVDIKSVESELGSLSATQLDKEIAEWDGYEARLRLICRMLNLELDPEVSSDVLISAQSLKVIFEELEAKLKIIIDRKDELIKELNAKEAMLGQVRDYLPFALEKGGSYSFLEVVSGRLNKKSIEVFERNMGDLPYVFYPVRSENDFVVAIIIGLRRDKIFLQRVLNDLGFQSIDLSGEAKDFSQNVGNKLLAQIKQLKTEIAALNQQLAAIANSVRQKLAKAYADIGLKKAILSAKRYAYATDKTALLTGWVPQQDKAKVVERIQQIAGDSYIETKLPQSLTLAKEEIPVRLEHNKFLKPFELLIDSYGVLRYGSIDPTFFVAISFLIMFGAMFGDVGHGLVLSLASLFLAKNKSAKIKQAAVLILYCGLSSVVFGFLFGSFFGFEFPSLWLKPMDDVIKVFTVSVIFGVGVITLGIILNIINALRDRDYLKVFLDKAGLVSGIIYWAAVAFISKWLLTKQMISDFYLAVIAAGIGLIFLKPFFAAIVCRHKEGFFQQILDGLIEVLELGISYLSNTISFVRIAAYALTHAILFMVIFELAHKLSAVGSGLILIFGNIGIIFLEGLVASIQSVRLNYYEFFSKFFIAGKNIYKPLTAGYKRD